MGETSELITKLNKHDPEALSEVFHLYSKLIWAVASGILSGSEACSREDVEECVCDTFFSLWEHPEKYDSGRGSLRSYLCLVARSRALNLYSIKNKNAVLYLEDIPNEAKEEFSQPVDYGELYTEIRNLTEPTRSILIRRYFYEEKPRVIADKMSLPVKEVENRLYRAKHKLSSILSHLREVK